MKRLVITVLCLMMSAVCALSEAAPEWLACACGQEECVCFAVPGDEGYLIRAARDILMEKGYLEKTRTQEQFDENMLAALTAFQRDNGLDETGVLDDETLTTLFATETDISDSRRFYVPVNGGSEIHLSPLCSGMKNPRLISAANAMYLYDSGAADWCDICGKALKNN